MKIPEISVEQLVLVISALSQLIHVHLIIVHSPMACSYMAVCWFYTHSPLYIFNVTTLK